MNRVAFEISVHGIYEKSSILTKLTIYDEKIIKYHILTALLKEFYVNLTERNVKSSICTGNEFEF